MSIPKFIVLMLFLTTSVASAHSWYEQYCCNEEDCRPISCEEVTQAPGGYFYHKIFFAKDKLKASQDQGCHACFYGTDIDNPNIVGRCLYLPGTS